MPDSSRPFPDLLQHPAFLQLGFRSPFSRASQFNPTKQIEFQSSSLFSARSIFGPHRVRACAKALTITGGPHWIRKAPAGLNPI